MYLYFNKSRGVRIAENPLVEYCDEIHSSIDKSICQTAVAIKGSIVNSVNQYNICTEFP